MHSQGQVRKTDPTEMKTAELFDKDFKRNTLNTLKERRTR